MKDILIVDDNVDLAANLAEILESHGNTPVIAADGDEALELVRTRPIDAVLTDMRMPKVSGPELVREIRKLKPGMPVLAFTAYSNAAELAQAEALGLLAVLPKPVPVQRLVNLLQAARPGGLVLLVEDDEAFRENVAEVLRERGLTVICVPTLAAVEGIAQVKPFAALVDLKLPDAPGGEAVERVRQRFPEVPQVVMTAHVDLLAKGLSPDGAAMVKPVDMRALLGRLEALYQSREDEPA